MRFIDRKDEMEKLKEYNNLSKKQLMFIAISGLRRVGKTTLIKEFIKNKKSLYFFVYESKTSAELLKELNEELKAKKIITEFEAITSWKQFFEILFSRCSGYTIIFDEFQNFYSVDKSVFSVLQKICDENKNNKINLIILGSLIGLFKKIFENKKEPLYGRINSKLRLNPFTLGYSIHALKHLKYEDLQTMLEICGIFGGYPKYYAAIEQFGLYDKKIFEIIEYLFIQENAPLENEVVDILRQEFGRRSSLYYSILNAIASGKTKLNEIATSTGMKESSITRHLAELEEKFELIKAMKPIGNKKNTRYCIQHPLILFWFRFVYSKFSEFKLKNTKQTMQTIKSEFNSYFGRRFEEIVRESIVEMNKQNMLPLSVEYLSNWWGSKREEGERKEIEIDLIALDEKNKKAMFVECKWKENVDAQKVVNELKEKAGFVKWNNNKRKEYFCIFAKSFKKKINENNILLFDLKDLEKIIDKQG